MNDILLTRRRKVARFTCRSVPMRPGTAGKLFSALGAESINVIHMFNADHGEDISDITFSVGMRSYDKTKAVLERIQEEIGAKAITVDNDLALLSFDLRETGCNTALETMSVALRALHSRHIEVKHISASSNRIFVVLFDRDADKASGVLSGALKEDPVFHPV